MNVKTLNYFISAAESKSFSKAARKCYISTNALIKNIDQVEAEVGSKLFVRASTGVSLTKAGVIFFEYAKKITELMSEAIVKVKECKSDTSIIRIGTSALRRHYPLLEVCSSYCRENKNVKFQIVPFVDPETEQFTPHTFFNNLGKDYDLIFCSYPPDRWGGQCEAVKIGVTPFNVCVPFDHPLAAKKEITLKDFESQTVVITTKGANKSSDKIIDYLTENVRNIFFDFRITSFQSINEALKKTIFSLLHKWYLN